MAIVGTNFPTLVDVAKRLDPDGKIAAVAEMLAQVNGLLDDIPFIMGNTETGTRMTIRTGLPTVIWRMLYKGVPPSKSTTAQVDEQCAMLEARSEIDVDLANLNGNSAAWRLSEQVPFLEAITQKLTACFLYGNSALNPEQFNGLSPRFSAIAGAVNGANVISGGGSGSDNTSIWLVVWGPQTVHGIFPKNSKAGLLHEDLGTIDAFDSSNNRYRALADRWQWKVGLAVKDWRFVVRICNIDVSDLVANAGSQALLPNLLIKAMHRIPNMGSGRPVFYCNRTVMTMLDIQRRDNVKSGGQLSYEFVDGKWVPNFRGIPIRLIDQILETEATVV